MERTRSGALWESALINRGPSGLTASERERVGTRAVICRREELWTPRTSRFVPVCTSKICGLRTRVASDKKVAMGGEGGEGTEEEDKDEYAATQAAKSPAPQYNCSSQISGKAREGEVARSSVASCSAKRKPGRRRSASSEIAASAVDGGASEDGGAEFGDASDGNATQLRRPSDKENIKALDIPNDLEASYKLKGDT
uniref:RNA-directed DNA polymerase n=1 Tax=Steinernema glaseri TaxID=37863 RepID=A0A1I7YJD5_9BILA